MLRGATDLSTQGAFQRLDVFDPGKKSREIINRVAVPRENRTLAKMADKEPITSGAGVSARLSGMLSNMPR